MRFQFRCIQNAAARLATATRSHRHHGAQIGQLAVGTTTRRLQASRPGLQVSSADIRRLSASGTGLVLPTFSRSGDLLSWYRELKLGSEIAVSLSPLYSFGTVYQSYFTPFIQGTRRIQTTVECLGLLKRRSIQLTECAPYKLLTYYAPAPKVGALSDDARLTSVCRVHWA